ncbi:complement receptor type 2-like isoform X2 [Myxocyprinus asiaticus]|uniref:complement receptor type 2-like isoform X2 n=1 Tax=Myxocyprinus asiaticus TaxID=70543 RepID=UPI002221355F|nr:complement receptor type 2-like isoform X2 [Myxocyprinus asiaticus]
MGYKVLCLSVVAFLCLMKGEHVRAQCTKPHFRVNVVLSDGSILTDSFSNGSTVTFVCVSGYKPVNAKASRSVTCSGNQWTDLALSCTRKSCGSLPDFSNGRYEIPNGTLFGDTVTAVCNKGYMLSGRQSQRTCRAEGVWDGRDPVCETVKCPPPPVVENGQLEDVPLESYEYLQSVSYKCNSGFSQVGDSTLYCSEDGTFQSEPPKCVGGCPKPEIPHSFRIAGKSPPYHLNNFIKYKCEDGYKMEGDSNILCTENGWQPEPPKCIVVKCPPPPVVENGQLEDVPLESYEYLQSVSYKCNLGFLLIGKSVLRCSGDETFQPEPPKCVAQCREPNFGGNVVLSDKFRSTEWFSNGSTVTFECKPGHEPVDSTAFKSVTCVEKQWTKLQLICKGLPTPTPTSPPPTPVYVIVLSVLGVIVGLLGAAGGCFYIKKRNSKHYSQKVATGYEDGGL